MGEFRDLVSAIFGEGLTASVVGCCLLAGAVSMNATVGDAVKDSWQAYQAWSERPDIVAATPRGRPGPPAEYRRLAETVALDHAGSPGVGAAGLDGPKFVRLFSALVGVESGFNPHAVSSAGAIGLGQLMPQTAAELGVADPFEPISNLNGAARYLTAQLAHFGDVSLALAAYNAGPGRVLEYGDIPPFAETHAFVRLVLERARI